MNKLLTILIKIILGVIFIVALIGATVVTIAAAPVLLIVGTIWYLLRPKKYRIRYDGISVKNRWKISKQDRLEDWKIIGIEERHLGSTLFCILFSFFGLDLRVWFRREFLDDEKWTGI